MSPIYDDIKTQLPELKKGTNKSARQYAAFYHSGMKEHFETDFDDDKAELDSFKTKWEKSNLEFVKENYGFKTDSEDSVEKARQYATLKNVGRALGLYDQLDQLEDAKEISPERAMEFGHSMVSRQKGYVSNGFIGIEADKYRNTDKENEFKEAVAKLVKETPSISHLEEKAKKDFRTAEGLLGRVLSAWEELELAA